MKKKILIVSMIFILVISTAISVSAVAENDIQNKLIVSIPVGFGEGSVAYTKDVLEMEKFGPESFSVLNNGDIYILDSVDKQVEIFKKSGDLIDTINLPEDEEYYDMEVRNNGNVIVLTYKRRILEYDNKGSLINETYIELEGDKELYINFCSLYKNKNNDVVVRDLSNYTEINIDTKKVENKLDFIDIINDKDNKNKTILSYQGNDSIVEYDYQSGGTYPLNQTKKGDISFLETEVLIGKKIYVENRISKYNKGKKISMALAEPIIDYEIIPNKYIYSSKNGNAYQMVLNKNSIDIYELEFTKSNKTNINNALVNNVFGESEAKLSTDTIVSTRTLNDPYNAYHVASFMIDYGWDFDYDTMLTPLDSEKHTKPPQHLNESSEDGNQFGIPYKWGGFDGTIEFQNNIDGNKTAGDIDYDKVVDTTTGIDCSGFISRAYGFSSKLGTTTIPSYFSEIDWNDISEGDIANKKEDHVWMYDGTKYDANSNILGYYTRESAMDGSQDCAKYWYRDLADALTYMPMTID